MSTSKVKPVTPKTNKKDKDTTKNKDQYNNDSDSIQKLLVNDESEFKSEYKRIKEKKAIKTMLPKEEIIVVRKDLMKDKKKGKNILSQFSLYKKEIPFDYNTCIMNRIFNKEIWLEEANLIEKIVEKELEAIHMEFMNEINEEILEVNYPPQNIGEIIDNCNMNINSNINNHVSIDKMLNKEIIRELHLNHLNLNDKLVSLDEEQMILNKQDNIIKPSMSISNLSKANVQVGGKNSKVKNSSTNLSKTMIGVEKENLEGKELIDYNIRQSRIKEIKTIKENIDKKITNVELQVKSIIEEEAAQDFDKREAIKKYLENFKKDVAKSEEESKIYNMEYKKRLKLTKEKEQMVLKLPLIRKEEEMKKFLIEKEELVNKGKKYFEQRKKEFYKKAEKYDNMIKKGKNKDKSIKKSKKNYLFNKIQEEYHQKEIQEQEEYKKKAEKNHSERIKMMKPLRKEDFDEYARIATENKEKMTYEKERKRLMKLEELITNNASLPKSDSYCYQRIVAEKYEQKEKHQKEKLDKIYKNMKIQNFSKLVHEKLAPKIDPEKKKELTKRIEKLNEKRPPKHHRSKPKAGKWKLVKAKRNRSSDLDITTLNLSGVNNELNNSHNLNQNRSKSEIKNRSFERNKKWQQKKPLEKRPDYLQEIKKKREEKYNDGKFFIIFFYYYIFYFYKYYYRRRL